MPIDEEAIALLVCPETHEPVQRAPGTLVERLNQAIRRRELQDRRGEVVKSTVDDALVREDGKVAYAVRDDIPQMLIDEAIPLAQLGADAP